MEDLTVRRVLKDNKVPGTRDRVVQGQQKHQPWRRGCCRSLGRGPGGAVSSQVLDWTGGLEKEEFLKKKKKIETLRG